MNKFQNRSRKSLRAKWWDYSRNGAYFITICTKDREHFFGEIRNGKMILSGTGIIADILWHEIPNRLPFVSLGEFVVMPDHVHGILILDKSGDVNHPLFPNAANSSKSVGMLHATYPQQQMDKEPQTGLKKSQTMSIISPKSNTISVIIRSYKSAVTKHANRLGLKNGWQSLYHDRIIRDHEEYQRISEYIINNPQNWTKNR